MISFFGDALTKVYGLEHTSEFNKEDLEKLSWLFGGLLKIDSKKIIGQFIGPRKEMITPWSTNAVEITQNMGITGINRIEEFMRTKDKTTQYDPMLSVLYDQLDHDIFTIIHPPEPVIEIDDIEAYNVNEGLALSNEEIDYLQQVSKELGRKLTDSEIFGFSQVNSEHCRHKIFNGTFVLDGVERKQSLFKMIKATSVKNPNYIVSAYKDNVAFIDGPQVEQFAPKTQDKPDYFETKQIDSVISLKAETHNFPTTVEPFNGAATGSGGEIRDRLAGGKGSLPLAGTAVYMTSYSRLESSREWEHRTLPRKWLYQTPIDILIKASDGASDFGNKFGQPLICGSVLTFEHEENNKFHGYDKVIMLAGGIGFGKKQDSIKDVPSKGDKIVILGGDNYRIGMGGGAVSSVATGEFGNSIELNAIQRSNPEMQKRAMNAIRAMEELEINPIVSIHDHGAGGHLNCLSELVEETGGKIDVNALPVGDPTLSDREIVGNESQERMGLVIKEEDIDILRDAAARERSPMYIVGDVTNDGKFVFENKKTGKNPMDWELDHMFGSSPKTILSDSTSIESFQDIQYDVQDLKKYLNEVLQLEAVACKDWLTNKVDRSVTGKVAKQQTCGEIQLPLNNVAAMTIDYKNKTGIATSIGHSPIPALINAAAGSRLSVVEALTNLIWAPLTNGLKGVSLSANWMWPAKNEGENARLYYAVEALSQFAVELGINVPTGKDSLSMAQKYPDGKTVFSPGTVIVSAAAEASDVSKIVSPSLVADESSTLIYVDLTQGEFELGGSSFAQVRGYMGKSTPDIANAPYFVKAFNIIQKFIRQGKILAGHDISAGGMITTLLEMCFPTPDIGLEIELAGFAEHDEIKILFSEKPGLLIQVKKEYIQDILSSELQCTMLGSIIRNRTLKIDQNELDIDSLRDTWFKTSYLLDCKQSGDALALSRFNNYKNQKLQFSFPKSFNGDLKGMGLDINRKSRTNIKAAIIREKGVNGDREMAWCMHLAGFDVKDVHMTDLITGREDLSDVNFIVFVGGFSNSDVLGSAKGWAGAFLYNAKAKKALDKFYARNDTLSLGVCNGCQLMLELELIYPVIKSHPKMTHNDSGKFESAFIAIDIPENNSVLLSSLSNTSLGVWVAHGEGKFQLSGSTNQYNIVARYHYDTYPGNPNGSDYSCAAIASSDGRHLAIMPHIERSLYPHNWPYYPQERADEVTPWIEPFINAKKWIVKQLS
ncbi:MAG: phosphoribosylformylglycinamidine synthase [Bacteroidota bacterium]